MKREQKIREDKKMAAFTKPSVFEVKTTKEKREDLYKKLNQARLSKDFIKECMDVSNRLRDNHTK